MRKKLTTNHFNLEAARRMFLAGLLLFALIHISQHDLSIQNASNFDCEICHIEHFPQVLSAPISILSFPLFLIVSEFYQRVVYRRFEFSVGSIRSPPVL